LAMSAGDNSPISISIWPINTVAGARRICTGEVLVRVVLRAGYAEDILAAVVKVSCQIDRFQLTEG
jgi:hypothetical protein